MLPTLFDGIDEDRRLNVLHIGSALGETLDFFSRYRCRLHFIDLFADLARFNQSQQLTDADALTSPRQMFAELLYIPAGTRLDLCLFWDLFNFLDDQALAALLATLRPHLHSGSRAHCFAVHSLKTGQSGKVYGISDADMISLRSRPADLPCYAPRNRGQLERALDCFSVTRSVLLAESRLELLLSARVQEAQE